MSFGNIDLFQILAILVITIIGIRCWVDIRLLSQSKMLSRRGYWLILYLGPLSWLAQVVVIWFIHFPTMASFLLFAALTLAAAFAFKLNWWTGNDSQGVAKAIAIGEVTFPFVLAAIPTLEAMLRAVF